jgi:small neutral amino acid transporter SnatA (MarC family)
MKLDVLPLAFTMLAGPQIMSAIIFVTAPRHSSSQRTSWLAW